MILSGFKFGSSPRWALLAMLFFVCISSCVGKIGFWYKNTRPPVSNYDSVAFANMTVKINLSYMDGPGQILMKDPFSPEVDLYVGKTINRQSFDTQFILDMSYAIGIDTHRVFVTDVSKGEVHFSWEAFTVIVQFIFLERNETVGGGPTLLEAVALLTKQVQDRSSNVYIGTNITNYIDPLWGVQVNGWDVSLKLSYAIEIVGGSAVQEGYYLNQGGLGLCDLDNSTIPTYCEFERFFEDDVSRSLNISSYRIQILFIKASSLDSVLIHFRIMPPPRHSREPDVAAVIGLLVERVSDQRSSLYDGNVTLRVDPTWGVDGVYTLRRPGAARFTRKHYEYDPSRLNNKLITSNFVTSYDRCKANRRCNWGIVRQNQYTNDVLYYQKLFDEGMIYNVQLFLDYEDWRLGSRGFTWAGTIPPTQKGASSIPRARAADAVIRGAHFNPFEQRSLGPDIPALFAERNQGLVLSRQLQIKQVSQQTGLVMDIEGRIRWLADNIEWAVMDAELRSRKDVRANLTRVRQEYIHWRQNEYAELLELSASQCAKQLCRITFNTSSLTLTGAINDVGVIRTTADGTEVAVFSFNSIYLGPEVEVIIVGQRALSLVSKSTAIINTTFHAHPGTIGGFRGGESVAKLQSEYLNDDPRSLYICDLGKYCLSNVTYDNLVSNNVNGPGSGNLRVTPFVIVTSATHVNEVQVIQTSAKRGQTLGGGFILHYGAYSTSLIPYDATAEEMKELIESNLNLASPENYPVLPIRVAQRDGAAGVGVVSVSRAAIGDDQGGFTWSITFTSYIGNPDQMTLTSYLTGLEANVTIFTETQGNELGGYFTLSYMNHTSQPISVLESAKNLQQILMNMPPISTAYVIRTDPTNNCKDGLCPNGPYTSNGLMWMCYITTNANFGDVTPTSPTSKVAFTESEYYRITANIDHMKGIGANVSVSYGTSTATNQMLSKLSVERPFSLAFGGGGGSYGGKGGAGYGLNPAGPVYNDEKITDLLGGSGGCMRGIHPFEINAILGAPTGRGGHGGGAIEIVAANDIVIGNFGRFSMRGEDGQQASGGGGGGGGSGGSIILSAGGVIVNEGELDVSGGNGGFGGEGTDYFSDGDNSGTSALSGVTGLAVDSSLSTANKITINNGINSFNYGGGGGGGGRIALYAESIINRGRITVDGGRCGILRLANKTSVAIVTMQLSLIDNVFGVPLDDIQVLLMSEFMVNATVVPMFVKATTIQRVVLQNQSNDWGSYDIKSNENGSNNTKVSLVEIDITVVPGMRVLNSQLAEHLNASTTLSDAVDQLIIALKANENMLNIGTISLHKAELIRVNYTDLELIINIQSPCTNHGSDGTYFSQASMTTAMYVRETDGGEGTQRALFFSNREITNTSSGSVREAPFSWNGPVMPFEPSQPQRVTYYTRVDPVPGESSKGNYGALFSLLSRGVEGLNVSSVIGVYVGDRISHGANFGSAVDEKYYDKQSSILWNYPVLGTWYKVDIHIDWDSNTYSVLLNDEVKVTKASFSGRDVDGIRISVTRAVDVWFDEIYVGFDNMMGFTCPFTDRSGTSTVAPVQQHWSYDEVHGGGSGFTGYVQMTRHYNHLDTTGSIPFDGQGLVNDFQDIKFSYPNGDIPLSQGKLHAGALRYLTGSVRSGKQATAAAYTLTGPNGLWYAPGNAGDGRQFWYTEYSIDSNKSKSISIPVLNGGVAACSSQDLQTWRFEGFVFQYTNLTDMVFGAQGPFYLERPKVQFESKSKTYVMWAAMDNNNRSLAMNAIATSPYEDGPFYFRRSFYPDGNQTRDQVFFFDDNNMPMIARTYFQTVEYLLPAAMMQPVWESVKFRNGSVNFRSSYHRAVFDAGYDNYHDIYNQRWRNESNPWDVVCVDKITGAERYVEAGVYNEAGTVCNDPDEYKIVYGQGNPVVQSLFLNPNTSDNSWWVQTSVPAVKAQPWASSYRDGYCGIRLLNDNYETNDPNLDSFSPQKRGNCSNIADNPVHVSLQDKLIGVQRVIMTRRAKYLAMSSLTSDLMDTTGVLTSFEGEFGTPNGVALDLLSMLTDMGQFGLSPGSNINSTFRPPVRSIYDTADDYAYRFRQYIRNPNDRASYALACVLDGVCPVNFKEQLTTGHV